MAAHHQGQLWHVGRASHPDYQPGAAAPISSGTLPINDGSQCYSPVSMQVHTCTQRAARRRQAVWHRLEPPPQPDPRLFPLHARRQMWTTRRRAS